MLKFKFNKDKNSKSFVFTRINIKSSSNNDDFFIFDNFFNHPKKDNFFKQIKRKIDNSKIGGLIYIFLFFLMLFMARATFRFLYYTSSITPDEYNIISISKSQQEAGYQPDDPDYLSITIKFEVDDEIVSSHLLYDRGDLNIIYKDWITYSTSYNSNIDIDIKNKIGTLYYNKKNPQKVIDNRFF